jgi:hypothetical protein
MRCQKFTTEFARIEASFLVQITVDSTELHKKTSALKCGTLIDVEWITEGQKL